MGKNSRYDEREVFSGQILLFKRKFNGKENPFWQAKIKVPSSKGHMTISTRSKYPDEAERIAIQHFRKAEARTQSGYPLKQVTFERAAKEYGDWKGQQYMTGRCSKEILDYHKVILRKSLVPFFLGKYLHKITSYDIEEYQGQRQNFGTKKGKRASPATLNRDNAVIRAVFKYAKQKKYISDIPIIDNISAFAQRPSFTTKEAEIFKEKLVEWVGHTHEFDGPHVMDYRKLFRLYCLVIYFSGIRPGKEMASLRWEDLEFVNNEELGYVLLAVKTAKKKNGVFAPRKVVALPELWVSFQEFEGTHLRKEEGYIFAHPLSTQLNRSYVGEPIMSFKTQWKNFINWAGLEYEKKFPRRRRTLYSLRHLYFEQRLINSDAGLHDLAKNCGTSPEVIQRWYNEVDSVQFAARLSRITTN